MKKLIIALLILVCILISTIALNTLPPTKTSPYVLIDNTKFNVDVAKTPQQQETGLAIYKSLPLDRGMLFPFATPGYYEFWMKNMKFSIDIIYIRGNTIVDIFRNVPPPASADATLPILTPKALSDTVLEINSGLSEKYGFKAGDRVKIFY